MRNILILNGPNLNLVGVRQPEIYGSKTFDVLFSELRTEFQDNNAELSYFQSNHEGDLIDQIHKVGFSWEGIVLNAGAYSHTSIAIADAIRSIPAKVVEVHISNIYERETFRHLSYLKDVCQYHVIGKGMDGYREAILWLLDQTE